jgi:hypothetical protein
MLAGRDLTAPAMEIVDSGEQVALHVALLNGMRIVIQVVDETSLLAIQRGFRPPFR